MSHFQVAHQPGQRSFVADCDGAQALLTYRRLGADLVDFNHTYVPKAARGSGVAEKLVRTAAQWARSEGYEIVASCWYARRVLGLDASD